MARKIAALFLISFLLYPGLCCAEPLSLIQRLLYKEVYVVEPNGRETAALVNKLTDEAEYSWAVDKWIEAPEHIKHCYKNQRRIRAQVDKFRAYRAGKR